MNGRGEDEDGDGQQHLPGPQPAVNARHATFRRRFLLTDCDTNCVLRQRLSVTIPSAHPQLSSNVAPFRHFPSAFTVKGIGSLSLSFHSFGALVCHSALGVRRQRQQQQL